MTEHPYAGGQDCPACEETLRIAARYCPWCGASLREVEINLLLFRAYHQLIRAREQIDRDDDAQLWDYVQGAAGRTESARVLVEGPEVLEDDTG